MGRTFTQNDKIALVEDPKVIAGLVHEGRYSMPYLPEGIYAELRNLTNQRLKNAEEKTRAMNRLKRWLSIYFPRSAILRGLPKPDRYRNWPGWHLWKTVPGIAMNDEFKEIYQYYLKRDKNPLKKMQALIAVSCKLLRVLYVMITKGVKYDGTKMLGDIRRPEKKAA